MERDRDREKEKQKERERYRDQYLRAKSGKLPNVYVELMQMSPLHEREEIFLIV
jgi:hypothetical protein